ncbi:transposable element Tcb2 transposase [Trichonephila clavipes]|nr:transposable element Tcb2 transposase [Trichonephila clavipes]
MGIYQAKVTHLFLPDRRLRSGALVLRFNSSVLLWAFGALRIFKEIHVSTLGRKLGDPVRQHKEKIHVSIMIWSVANFQRNSCVNTGKKVRLSDEVPDEVEKLAYQLNEEAERTERPIRRLSKVMYGRTCADIQVDVMGECLSSMKHVVGASRNRWQTAGEIARHTTHATGRPIPRYTVARRLHGGGLFARRPIRCVPLTPALLRRRSLWCREHRNWRNNEWGRVLFTDESRFSLSSDSHRILIWRERGSCNHPSNIIERDRGAMGLQFLFLDDNAPRHRTVAAEQLLESEDIERMDWPARSPDLNPIEHVWDFLGRRLAARTLPPVTIRELRLVQDEWAAMPQQLIDTLILSMGRRCETCLVVREIISPTKDRMFLVGHPSQGCFRPSVALRSMLLFQSSFFLSL